MRIPFLQAMGYSGDIPAIFVKAVNNDWLFATFVGKLLTEDSTRLDYLVNNYFYARLQDWLTDITKNAISISQKPRNSQKVCLKCSLR